MTPVTFFLVLAPIAAIEYLKAALTLVGNHDIGMAFAALDRG